jgi:alpha-L-arabinofuranosidase
MQKFIARTAAICLLLASAGCVEGGASKADSTELQPLPVTVQVDPEDVLRVVPPHAYGMHASLYDNKLHDPALASQLDDAGISLLRWPGGGYSDNYHWASHSMTRFSDGKPGYLAEGSDFGAFVEMLDRVGRSAMITVNYGSNRSHDGPGEPKEAAAWVAYANGAPDDETVIGEDGTGFDWQTVGYWASLRSSVPLDVDDGKNFLRIERPDPIDIEYWEVGNEVFGNGYYASGDDDGFELDMHVPYDGTSRRDHPDLSPARYGQGVAEFVAAMKAVDPSIKVGAVLVTPPADNSWAPTWNDEVLAECATVIDFGVIHFYPSDPNLLTVSSRLMPDMFEQLHDALDRHAGENADDIEITVTEVGPPPGYDDYQDSVMGLFAADAYLSFIRHGATNVDWLELHNGTFLSERFEPGSAYYGIQLAHATAGPGEALVRAESSRPLDIVAHAGVRDDDSVAVLLINTSSHRVTEVTIDVPGASGGAMLRSLSSSESHASESYAPEVSGPEPVEATDGALIVTLPPETVMLVELDAP